LACVKVNISIVTPHVIWPEPHSGLSQVVRLDIPIVLQVL